MSRLGRQRGFSLLEVLVALAIMAMSLGLLYRATGGSVRAVGDMAMHERAAMLADSLMAAYETVPPEGVQAAGTSAGLNWQVSSRLQPTPLDGNPRAVRLHALHIVIGPDQEAQARAFEFTTLRPQRKPPQGG